MFLSVNFMDPNILYVNCEVVLASGDGAPFGNGATADGFHKRLKNEKDRVTDACCWLLRFCSVRSYLNDRLNDRAPTACVRDSAAR